MHHLLLAAAIVRLHLRAPQPLATRARARGRKVHVRWNSTMNSCSRGPPLAASSDYATTGGNRGEQREGGTNLHTDASFKGSPTCRCVRVPHALSRTSIMPRSALRDPFSILIEQPGNFSRRVTSFLERIDRLIIRRRKTNSRSICHPFE